MTNWKSYRSFPQDHKPLREHLPKYYAKRALQLCSGPFNLVYVHQVALGKRYNKEIESALAWVAMENILDKLLRFQP